MYRSWTVCTSIAARITATCCWPSSPTGRYAASMSPSLNVRSPPLEATFLATADWSSPGPLCLDPSAR